MRRLSFYFVAAALALQLIPLGLAQQASVTAVPNLIRYGGALKDAQGAALASSTVGVTFAIYGQQEGGAAVWMETQNVTTDAAGNFSVLLGATTATGLPGDLFSQQEQRWLGVQVQGEPEQARVMMVSVPYALKAHEADTLGGRSVSDFVLAAGAGSTSGGGSTSQSTPAAGASSGSTGSVGNNTATMDGPTNFTGSTTDQIVGVTQSWNRGRTGRLRAYFGYQGHRDRSQRHSLRCPGCRDRNGGCWTHRHRELNDWFYLWLAGNFEQHGRNGRARNCYGHKRQHHRHKRLRR